MGTRGAQRFSAFLLVENDDLLIDSTAGVINHYYKDRNLILYVAKSYEQAVALCEQHEFEVVIMDYNLDGDLTGADLTTYLLEKYPQLKILANGSSAANNNELMSLGAIHCLDKEIMPLVNWLRANDPL